MGDNPLHTRKENSEPPGGMVRRGIRHHVASILADSGKASLSQIQKMLRHRRTTTTDNYIKTLDPQLRQVANVLDEQGKVSKKIESSTIGSTI